MLAIVSAVFYPMTCKTYVRDNDKALAAQSLCVSLRGIRTYCEDL